MNRRLRIAITAVVVAVLGLAWVLGRHSHSGRALEQYRAQLRARGEKLTLAELAPLRAAGNGDSQTPITNAVAAIRAITGNRLAPGNLELRRYVGPGKARAAWMDDSPVMRTSNSPALFWNEFAAKLPAVEPSLRQIRAALTEPEPDAGPVTNIMMRRVNFVALRSAAQWLMGATLSEVRGGQLEEALQNLEALAALARMERDEPTLVAQMIRVAITGLGTSTTWEALQAPGWTEPQLARLQRAWQSVDLVDAVRTGFIGERALGEEFWVQMRTSNSTAVRSLFGLSASGRAPFVGFVADHILFPIYKQTSLDNDELFRLQYMQETVDGLRLLREHHPWSEVRTALSNATARLQKLQRSPKRIRYPWSMISIPNFSRAVETALRNETERQLTLAAIAISRFELRRGALPSSLEALVPEFLPSVPYDPMSGRTLQYRRGTNHDFVLYSVGEDEQDDGGDATPQPGARPSLWEGRDAVWPAAVPPPEHRN